MNDRERMSEERGLGIQRELAEVLEAYKPAGNSLPRDLREILDYIHVHLFEETLSVKTVRRSCRIGNHNVSSRFRLAVGTSIGDYIKRLRMEVAIRLLWEEHLEIYRIGSLVGYSHQESFTRTFRRYYGCSPSVYRQQLLAGERSHRSRQPVKN